MREHRLCSEAELSIHQGSPMISSCIIYEKMIIKYDYLHHRSFVSVAWNNTYTCSGLHGGSLLKWLFILTMRLTILLKRHPVFTAGAYFPNTTRPFPAFTVGHHIPPALSRLRDHPTVRHLWLSHDFMTTRVQLLAKDKLTSPCLRESSFPSVWYKKAPREGRRAGSSQESVISCSPLTNFFSLPEHPAHSLFLCTSLTILSTGPRPL